MLLYDQGICETFCFAELYAGQYCPRMGAAAAEASLTAIAAETSASTAAHRVERDRIFGASVGRGGVGSVRVSVHKRAERKKKPQYGLPAGGMSCSLARREERSHPAAVARGPPSLAEEYGLSVGQGRSFARALRTRAAVRTRSLRSGEPGQEAKAGFWRTER